MSVSIKGSRMRWALGLFALTSALLIASPVAAQETGTLACHVYDQEGQPVTGATVRVTDVATTTTQSTLSSLEGEFGFVLLPGAYQVVAEKTGLGRGVRSIEIDVRQTTACELTLEPRVLAPTVRVVAPAARIVDLRSADVNLDYKRDFFQDLPLDRSYLGMLQLIPGIAENNGFAPNGGGSRQDNTFLLDSVNITNPLFGYLSTEVNELDIAQVSVKRGAIQPEFGRLTGFASNAVTKSGTNLFTGNYRVEAIPNAWIADTSKPVRSPPDRWVHAFDAGGPIVKNRLFYYGSGRIYRSKSSDAINVFGPIPNRVEKTDEYFGKITAQFKRHIVTGGYRRRPTRIDFANIGANDTPTMATNETYMSRVAHVTDDWYLGGGTSVSLKYVHLDENNESVAATDLGFQPPFNSLNLAAMGRFVLGGLTVGAASLKLNRQDYSRDEIKAVVTRFFNVRSTSHQVKAGFGWEQGVENLTRKSNGWGNISYVNVNGELRVRATYYPDQPPQRSVGRTQSIFVQDGVAFGSRLVVNAGVLLNRDEFVQEANQGPGALPRAAFLTFGFTDEIQPRLGISLQLRKSQADRLYANWGRSYGLDQKGGARAVASGRLYTEDADFDPEGDAVVARTASANTGPRAVAPDLKPPVTDETVVGYATPLREGWSIDAFFLSRRSTHFIEDAPAVLPFADFQFQNDPFARRNYRTVTMEVRGQLQNRLFLNASYAWSRFSGNYDQDYWGDLNSAASFRTSSLVDDGPGGFSSDRFRDGVLSQDRTHTYKILATWKPTWIDHLTLGMFVRGQSGTPWEARGLPWDSSVSYLRYLEPAGAHRNPFWTNVDLLPKVTFNLTAMRRLHLEGRILNVFNRETVLLVDQRQYLDPRILTIAGTPTSGCWSCYTDAFPQGVVQPNPRFGQPIAFAQPRRFLLSVLLDF